MQSPYKALFKIPDNKKRDSARKDIFFQIEKLKYLFLKILMRIFTDGKFMNRLRCKLIRMRSYLPKEILIHKGDTVVQVGTHRQDTVERLVKLVGISGKVIIIEAEKSSYDYLQSYVQKKKYGNVHLVNIAASNKKGTANFLLSNVLSDHRLRDDNIIHDNDSRGEGYIADVTVDMDTIDNIMKKIKVNIIDFIEITVNGAELKVIQGMKDILSHTRRIYTKGYAIDLKTGNEIGQEIMLFLKQRNFNVVVGKPSKSVTENTWGKRKGDIFAWSDN